MLKIQDNISDLRSDYILSEIDWTQIGKDIF